MTRLAETVDEFETFWRHFWLELTELPASGGFTVRIVGVVVSLVGVQLPITIQRY